MFAACSTTHKMFAPAQSRWPVARDARVRRAGMKLLIYGAGLHNQAEADKDAREALVRYLGSLSVAGEPEDRAERMRDVLEAFPPARSWTPAEGFTSLIDVDLSELNRLLHTRYE